MPPVVVSELFLEEPVPPVVAAPEPVAVPEPTELADLVAEAVVPPVAPAEDRVVLEVVPPVEFEAAVEPPTVAVAAELLPLELPPVAEFPPTVPSPPAVEPPQPHNANQAMLEVKTRTLHSQPIPCRLRVIISSAPIAPVARAQSIAHRSNQRDRGPHTLGNAVSRRNRANPPPKSHDAAFLEPLATPCHAVVSSFLPQRLTHTATCWISFPQSAPPRVRSVAEEVVRPGAPGRTRGGHRIHSRKPRGSLPSAPNPREFALDA